MASLRAAVFTFITVCLAQVNCDKTCFTCNRVAHPRDCTRISTCGPNQICYLEQKITPDGHIFFNSGCKDTLACQAIGRRSLSKILQKKNNFGQETTSCIECCQGDYCNYGGCGEPSLPPRSQRGPICFNCDSQRTDSDCNVVTVCERDCECHIMKVPDQIYDHVYKSGCASKIACQSASLIGRRDATEHKRADTFCFSCCNDDFCNRNCTHPPHHTPPPTTAPTTTTTTPKPTPATCPPDTVGNGASCYLFSTEIKYWEEARQICNLKNGALLKIDDAKENHFIIQHLKQMMSSGQIPGDVWGYYMGANLNAAKQWVWTDGSPLNYHDWAPGEPDLPDDQPYGFIFLPGHYAGAYQWGSHKNMQGTSRYICEIPHP